MMNEEHVNMQQTLMYPPRVGCDQVLVQPPPGNRSNQIIYFTSPNPMPWNQQLPAFIIPHNQYVYVDCFPNPQPYSQYPTQVMYPQQQMFSNHRYQPYCVPSIVSQQNRNMSQMLQTRTHVISNTSRQVNNQNVQYLTGAPKNIPDDVPQQVVNKMLHESFSQTANVAQQIPVAVGVTQNIPNIAGPQYNQTYADQYSKNPTDPHTSASSVKNTNNNIRMHTTKKQDVTKKQYFQNNYALNVESKAQLINSNTSPNKMYPLVSNKTPNTDNEEVSSKEHSVQQTKLKKVSASYSIQNTLPHNKSMKSNSRKRKSCSPNNVNYVKPINFIDSNIFNKTIAGKPEINVTTDVIHNNESKTFVGGEQSDCIKKNEKTSEYEDVNLLSNNVASLSQSVLDEHEDALHKIDEKANRVTVFPQSLNRTTNRSIKLSIKDLLLENKISTNEQHFIENNHKDSIKDLKKNDNSNNITTNVLKTEIVDKGREEKIIKLSARTASDEETNQKCNIEEETKKDLKNKVATKTKNTFKAGVAAIQNTLAASGDIIFHKPTNKSDPKKEISNITSNEKDDYTRINKFKMSNGNIWNMNNDSDQYILTHVLDGIVIQESNQSFPISNTRSKIKPKSNKTTLRDESENGDVNIKNSNAEVEGHPFTGLDPEEIKLWTCKQLVDSLKKFGWQDVGLIFDDEEIDGESLFLCMATQLQRIGVDEKRANTICSFTQMDNKLHNIIL